jgi:WD40 repeat protein
MQAARNNLSMCVSPDERWIFAGSLSGQISTIDIDSFAYRSAVQAHAGGIHAITVHPTLPYVATMSTERAFSIWRHDDEGRLSMLVYRNVRSLQCSNDTEYIPYIQSTSQAICFHPTRKRLLTRTGSGGLLEVDFDDDGRLDTVQCVRLHGEEDLVAVRYLKDSDRILTMANYGEVAVSDEGRVLDTWRFGYHNVHWAEHLEGDTYLLASDTRQVIRLDLSRKQEPVVGPALTRDDLEHVTLNRRTGRAFIAGFDSNVYEVCPQTCRSLGVVYKAPYKCRWVKTLERSPDTMILQCRNGGLHRIDLAGARRTALLKDTPEAVWSAAELPDGDLVLCGEARAAYRLHLDAVDVQSRAPQVTVRRTPIDVEGDAHFKRLDVQASTGKIVLGRTDGQIWVGADDRYRPLCRVEMPVRDLCVHPTEPWFFACTEGNRVYKIGIDDGKILNVFESPAQEQIWTLAYNPERNLLAFAEREGSVYVIDADSFQIRHLIPDVRRPKRMRWRDANTLLWSRSVELHRFDLDTGRAYVFVRETGNTIEDFIWDEDRRYLVVLNYNCLIILCDYETGEFIDVTPDAMDYSKGLAWVPRQEDSYPLDFVCFGRNGLANLFRIHDEKILPMGPITRDGWSAAPGVPKNSA